MQNHLRIISFVCCCIAMSAIQGCISTTEGGAVGARRSQLMLISSEELEAVADQSYTRLKADARSKGELNRDSALLERVRAIGMNIKPHTAVFRKDAPAWNWEVNVIGSDELNAFCMPGGKIMFYSGLITRLNLNDDEIAIVMGHEIAHALREHSREQVSQAIAAQTAISIGTALLGLGQVSAEISSTVYESLIASKFSRTDESEADDIGLELTARSGYDPRAGVTLWRKMIAVNSVGAPPELLSTHPAEASRIQKIQSLLPAVLPLYEASKRSGM